MLISAYNDPQYYQAVNLFSMFPESLTNIASQNISIGNYGSLGTSGTRYVVLPDNDDVVVTPNVNSIDYTFSVSEQKFRAIIEANNVILHPNDIAPNATFCVGQNITFSIAWSPQVPTAPFYSPNTPTGIASIAYLWNLPGSYVNEYQVPDPPSTGSTEYSIDPSFLANPTTSCWYINSPGGTAKVGINLTFSDGQQAAITTKGQLSVFRPSVTGLIVNSPFYAALVPTTNNPNELQLGRDSGGGAMAFSFSVNSAAPFTGQAALVQLVNRDDVLTATITKSVTTFGQFWLDNTYPYNTPSTVYSGYHYVTGVEFNDQPGLGLEYEPGLYGTACSINDSFKDYVIFKPDGQNSIYVTLGRIFWGWTANTSLSSGVWSNPSYSFNNPSTPDNSDEFPSYPETFFNVQPY